MRRDIFGDADNGDTFGRTTKPQAVTPRKLSDVGNATAAIRGKPREALQRYDDLFKRKRKIRRSPSGHATAPSDAWRLETMPFEAMLRRRPFASSTTARRREMTAVCCRLPDHAPLQGREAVAVRCDYGTSGLKAPGRSGAFLSRR